VIPFKRIGITEMCRTADEPGGVANSEIVSRLFSGGKAVQNFDLMRETLGETSPEFAKLKRSIADHILEKSRLPGEETIDSRSFIQNLSAFRTDYREIADQVFGKDLNEFYRQARFIGIAKGDKVDAGELQTLLKDPSKTAGKFKALINAEKERDSLYRNDLLKMVAQKNIPSGALKPEEFVNRFLDKATRSEVAQVMDLVKSDPALTDDIRSKTVEKIFRDGARQPTPGDIGKLMSDDPTRIVSGTSVFKQIESQPVRAKIEAIVGPEIYQDLVQYIKLQAGLEVPETSFKSAGGIAAGAQIATLMRRGPLKYLPEAIKNFVESTLITSRPLRAWLGSGPSTKDPGFVSLLLSSPPFIGAVTREFGKGTGADILISSIKNSVDRYVKTEASGQQPDAQPDATGTEDRRKLMQDFLRN
jgi:hypothetical protein